MTTSLATGSSAMRTGSDPRTERGRRRNTYLRAAVLVGVLALAGGWSGAAHAALGPEPSVIPNDGGCSDVYVDCGYTSGETGGPYAEGVGMYAYSPDAYAGRCRTVWAARTRRNLAGFVVWRYYQQVRWCWNGLAVTYFRRDRWPADTNFGWMFDGHVGSSCVYEHCPGRTGQSSANAWTQGQFHACLKWFCSYKYPIVSITVYANGAWASSTSG